MSVRKFAIDAEDPPRLELRFEGQQIHVWLDGAQEATLDGWAGFKKGWSKTLDDGRTLEVRTVRRAGLPEFSVLVDGEHAASSPSHPDRVLRNSSNVLLAVSAFMIVTGFTGTMNGFWLDVVFGAMYLIGALLLRVRRRVGAAVIALPMFIRLDLLLIALFTQGLTGGWIFEFIVTLIFLSAVVRSYQAARDSQKLRPIAR